MVIYKCLHIYMLQNQYKWFFTKCPEKQPFYFLKMVECKMYIYKYFRETPYNQEYFSISQKFLTFFLSMHYTSSLRLYIVLFSRFGTSLICRPSYSTYMLHYFYCCSITVVPIFPQLLSPYPTHPQLPHSVLHSPVVFDHESCIYVP